MRSWLLPTFLLLNLGRLGLADGVLEECLVKKNLQFEAENLNSASFSALPMSNGTFFTAQVIFKELSILHDSLTFTNRSVQRKRIGQRDDDEKEFPSPGAGLGWTEFSVSAGAEGYEFKDSEGRSWISEKTQGYKVDKVVIEKGVLIGACRGGTPTWRVTDNNCIKVPIAQPNSAWGQRMTLFSEENFISSFRVEGKEFELDCLNGTAFNATLQLILEGNILFKIMVNGQVRERRLTSLPTAVEVCGKLNGTFYLQLQPPSAGPKKDEFQNRPYGYILHYSVGGSLGGVGIVVIISLFCKRYMCQGFRGFKKPRNATRTEVGNHDPDSLYLEPINVPSFPGVTFPTSCLELDVTDNNRRPDSAGSSSSSEHIYEEVDKEVPSEIPEQFPKGVCGFKRTQNVTQTEASMYLELVPRPRSPSVVLPTLCREPEISYNDGNPATSSCEYMYDEID